MSSCLKCHKQVDYFFIKWWKLKGRMSINPFTSVCHFCEYGLDTLPPLIANLGEWNHALNKWEEWKGANHA